jgi:hypothetical protein
MPVILDYENVFLLDNETAKEISHILDKMPNSPLSNFTDYRYEVDEILRKKDFIFRKNFYFSSIDNSLELINPKLRIITLMQAIAEAHKRNDPTTDHLGIYILLCLFSFLEVMIRKVKEAR